MSSGLVSGGPVSLIYGFLRSSLLSLTALNGSDQMVVAIVGSMATAASLGEMVSMSVLPASYLKLADFVTC